MLHDNAFLHDAASAAVAAVREGGASAKKVSGAY
jgi:hypothetical protein